MLRMFEKQGERALLLLTNLKRFVDSSFTVGQAASQYYNGDFRSLTRDADSQLQDRTYRSAKAMTLDPTKLDEVIVDLSKLVHAAKGNAAPRDLIDEMARILQMPRGHFHLGSATLRQLQEAILIPEEIREFKAAVRTTLSCNSCGETISPGEYCSMRIDTDGVPFLNCVYCVTPTSVSCRECRRPVPVQAHSRGKDFWCAEHDPKQLKLKKLDLKKAETPLSPDANRRLADDLEQQALGIPRNAVRWADVAASTLQQAQAPRFRGRNPAPTPAAPQQSALQDALTAEQTARLQQWTTAVMAGRPMNPTVTVTETAANQFITMDPLMNLNDSSFDDEEDS